MALSHLRDWRDSIWFILSTITRLLSLSLAGVFWIFLLLSTLIASSRFRTGE